MAGGLWTRVKTWLRSETLKAADINAEIDNIKTNFIPAMMDDFSASVAQMRQEMNPGSTGAEIQATSLAEEIKELRYALRRAIGGTYWFDNPDTSLISLKNLLEGGLVLAPNRIESGRVDANNQPMFLMPNGGGSVKLDGAPTAFRCYINNSLVEVASDITLSGLTGPTAFACAVDDGTLTGTQATKTQGENGTTITIDTPTGTPPAVGSLQAWKISTEYFTAVYGSSTTLVKAFRGRFFNSSDASLARVAMSNNDAITMVRLAYVFFTYPSSVATLESTYTRPIVSKDQPSGASTGDFWFDTNAGIWKKYSGVSWNDASGLFIGMAVIDATNTVQACRSADFSNGFSALNTLALEKFDNATIQNALFGSKISVYGQNFEWLRDYPIWDMTVDLDSGVTEGASTTYYFYLTDLGDTIISDVAPHDRRVDLFGYYHPSKPWRCMGEAANDGSSNLGTPTTYDDLRTGQIITAKLADLSVTTGKLAALSVTRPKMEALGQQVSASSGSFSSTSATYVDVTNLSCTITTTGRPVMIMLISDGSSESDIGGVDAGSTSFNAKFSIVRDATILSESFINMQGASGDLIGIIPPGAVSHVDVVAAGTYVYKLRVKANAGTSVTVQACKLVVWEL